MRKRYCVGGTQASAASIMACLALLCVPAVSVAADPSDSPAEAADRASALLARGAGYGQPQDEPRVRALQRRLRALGQRPGPVDGLYGPLTEEAVERLQRDSGLAVDGIVGPQTRRVLNAATPPLVPGAGYGRPGGSPQVRAVQGRLRALGQPSGPVDGLYGPRTQTAVERFQRTVGQPASGVLSPATARALARADGDQPVRRASDTPRRDNKPRQGGRRPGADDQPSRADSSRPAEGSDQRRSRIPEAADARAEGTDGAESTSPILLGVLALALAAAGGVLVGWLRGRRRKPGASGTAGRPVQPEPMPNGATEAAKPSARSTAPSSPEAGSPCDGTAALGYVSVGEPAAVDGQDVLDQIAVIDTACRQRGLVLREVIRDREQVNGTAPQRPGVQYALQRLAAGEASCLVVAELGRLSRSAPEVGYIVEWLRRREARLVAVDEGLDTATRSGGEAADRLVSLCAFDGQRHPPEPNRQKRPQEPNGNLGPVPEPRPTEQANGTSRPASSDVPALKTRIRAMRASGMSLQAIADRLNAENVPTLRGGAKWRPSGVQAATGYHRPGPKASEPGNGNGGERGRSGSAGRGRGKSRRPPSSRTGGATR